MAESADSSSAAGQNESDTTTGGALFAAGRNASATTYEALLAAGPDVSATTEGALCAASPTCQPPPNHSFHEAQQPPPMYHSTQQAQAYQPPPAGPLNAAGPGVSATAYGPLNAAGQAYQQVQPMDCSAQLAPVLAHLQRLAESEGTAGNPHALRAYKRDGAWRCLAAAFTGRVVVGYIRAALQRTEFCEIVPFASRRI